MEKIINFSQISTKELFQQYEGYSFYSDCEGFWSLHPLKENTDRLQHASNAKSEMMRIYKMKDWQIKIVNDNNNVEIMILFAWLFKNTKIIKDEMKRFGFFPGISFWKIRGFMIWREIKFELE